jgi:hypothetical protein
MYEVWLVLNILWEIALGIWPLLLGGIVMWGVLMVTALRRPGARWRAGMPLALTAGAIVAVTAFLLVPGGTRSSLAELSYWVDWANLAAVAVGFGTVAALIAWPLLAMREPSRGT